MDIELHSIEQELNPIHTGNLVICSIIYINLGKLNKRYLQVIEGLKTIEGRLWGGGGVTKSPQRLHLSARNPANRRSNLMSVNLDRVEQVKRQIQSVQSQTP
jgi:hypothetical protein